MLTVSMTAERLGCLMPFSGDCLELGNCSPSRKTPSISTSQFLMNTHKSVYGFLWTTHT